MLSAEAAKLLRRKYCDLRQDDSSGGSSFKITVRQLESLIRLSEAYARVDLSPMITKYHVQEAFRLLSLTILKVHIEDYVVSNEELMNEVSSEIRNSNINNIVSSL